MPCKEGDSLPCLTFRTLLSTQRTKLERGRFSQIHTPFKIDATSVALIEKIEKFTLTAFCVATTEYGEERHAPMTEKPVPSLSVVSVFVESYILRPTCFNHTWEACVCIEFPFTTNKLPVCSSAEEGKLTGDGSIQAMALRCWLWGSNAQQPTSVDVLMRRHFCVEAVVATAARVAFSVHASLGTVAGTVASTAQTCLTRTPTG